MHRTPWDVATIQQQEHTLHITFTGLMRSEDILRSLVCSLITYGVAFIDEVPPDIVMTELAIRRVFPIMKTFFGEMWSFDDQVQKHADTAYTAQYIAAHTDNMYFCDAAGLVALHCIERANGTGGENFLLDSLHVAQELQRASPDAFKVLTTVPVPAEFVEKGKHHKHTAPIIRLDPVTGEIEQIRMNMYDRSILDTIPQNQMQQFYASFRQLLQISESPQNQWTVQLRPGTLMLFDNWRVFHGRRAYTGARHMVGAYIQRTEFLSKARVLGIIE